MRLLIEGEILNDVLNNQPNKHAMQGFFYNLLRNTAYDPIHNRSGFKYFCYSDVFPLKNCHRGGKVKVLFSSPWRQLLQALREQIQIGESYLWGGWRVKILNTKLFDVKLPYEWITGSPILLRYDPSGRGNTYFSFQRPGHSLQVFLKRLTENAVKKFQGFYGEFPDLTRPLFEEMVYDKTVVIPITVNGKTTPTVVTKWKRFKLPHPLRKAEKDFYKFLFDVGLGERNALGLGFVNPLNPPTAKKKKQNAVRSVVQ